MEMMRARARQATAGIQNFLRFQIERGVADILKPVASVSSPQWPAYLPEPRMVPCRTPDVIAASL